MSVNKVIVLGNLGNVPEVKYLEGGLVIANFSIATSEKYKNKSGEVVESLEWHRLVAYNNIAKIVEKYLVKGSQVYIEGRLKTRAWDDDKNIKRYTTEIIVENLQMLGGKKETQQTSTPGATSATPKPEEPRPEVNNEPQDDLPF